MKGVINRFSPAGLNSFQNEEQSIFYNNQKELKFQDASQQQALDISRNSNKRHIMHSQG